MRTRKDGQPWRGGVRPLPPGKTRQDRIDAFRRLIKAVTMLQRAQRELYAAIVQAFEIGWPDSVIARELGVSEDTAMRIRHKVENGYPDEFFRRFRGNLGASAPTQRSGREQVSGDVADADSAVSPSSAESAGPNH